jgi:hypothetical protein
MGTLSGKINKKLSLKKNHDTENNDVHARTDGKHVLN